MLDTKTWWQSRTIWLQIVSAFFAILATFHILPEGLDQEQVVGAIMGGVAIVTLVLRFRSTHAIALPFPRQAPSGIDAADSLIADEVIASADATKPAGRGCLAKVPSLALPAFLLTVLSGCATPGMPTSTFARLARISADFERAREFASPFLGFLSPDRAALIRAAAELVEKALAAARSATSSREREEALRTAETGTADYRLVTGG